MGRCAAAWWVAVASCLAVACSKNDAASPSDAPAAVSSAPVVQADAAKPSEAEPPVALASAKTPVDADASAEPAVADDDANAAAEPAEPETPAIPAEPYKVLVLGDSLAATGFGALLERRLDAHPHVVCYRKGKSSSGLARPDFFDWFAEAKRQVAQREPDLVIVIIGGNDGQDIVPAKRGERRVAWKHEEWASTYRARTDAFLDEISAQDRDVLWLGLPTMGLRSLERKLDLIRGIQKEAIEARGEGFVYLETAPYVSDESGEMLTEAPVGKHGKRQKIRAEDEIHFTMSGSEYLADKVYPEVLQVLGLEDIAPESDSP